MGLLGRGRFPLRVNRRHRPSKIVGPLRPYKRTSMIARSRSAKCQQATSRGTGVLAEARYSCQAGCEATARGRSVMLLVLI